MPHICWYLTLVSMGISLLSCITLIRYSVSENHCENCVILNAGTVLLVCKMLCEFPISVFLKFKKLILFDK